MTNQKEKMEVRGNKTADMPVCVRWVLNCWMLSVQGSTAVSGKTPLNWQRKTAVGAAINITKTKSAKTIRHITLIVTAAGKTTR